ncbi:MAG TPA: histidine phosphatase family protein, partial [Clostridia bacterium]|nr:histidine phosphatase family protein [Clostridia bacterium]
MKILIIRHGAPDYANDSLTEKGVREADLLARRLQKLPIRALYGSPLGRARRTMQPTAEALGMTPAILPWLTEFPGKMRDPDTGKQGIPWNQRPQFWTKQPEWYDYEAWKTHPLMRAGD